MAIPKNAITHQQALERGISPYVSEYECPKCGSYIRLVRRDKQNSSRGHCKECKVRTDHRRWEKEKAAAQKLRYYSKFPAPLLRIKLQKAIQNKKTECRRANPPIKCELNFEWLLEQLKAQDFRSPITGFLYEFGQGNFRDFSFERFDSSEDYTLENTYILDVASNTIISNMGSNPDYFRQVANYLENRIKERAK